MRFKGYFDLERLVRPELWEGLRTALQGAVGSPPPGLRAASGKSCVVNRGVVLVDPLAWAQGRVTELIEA